MIQSLYYDTRQDVDDFGIVSKFVGFRSFPWQFVRNLALPLVENLSGFTSSHCERNGKFQYALFFYQYLHIAGVI